MLLQRRAGAAPAASVSALDNRPYKRIGVRTGPAGQGPRPPPGPRGCHGPGGWAEDDFLNFGEIEVPGPGWRPRTVFDSNFPVLPGARVAAQNLTRPPRSAGAGPQAVLRSSEGLSVFVDDERVSTRGISARINLRIYGRSHVPYIVAGESEISGEKR